MIVARERTRMVSACAMNATALTSREVIRRVLAFERPPRIGMNFDGGRMNDLIVVGPEPDPSFDEQRRTTESGAQRWLDEWGNTWERLDAFSIGEVAEGAIGEWSDLDRYEPPELLDRSRYADAKRRLAEHADKYPIGWLPGFPFAVGRKLRTMARYLLDVAAEPDRVRDLNAVIRRVLLGQIELYAELGCRGVGFCEDWGTQERLLISPAHWRALFRPEFEALCDAVHGRGMTVWMHSCGRLVEIIDDLIEVGVDVLQFDQPALYGIDLLAERCAGRVAFWCPVDIQTTLQSGDRDRIRAEAKALVEKLGRDGGFIAKNYPGLDAINVKPEWDQWAYEAFVEFGGRAG
jgi:uroporphyrinogen decarboxylase